MGLREELPVVAVMETCKQTFIRLCEAKLIWKQYSHHFLCHPVDLMYSYLHSAEGRVSEL